MRPIVVSFTTSIPATWKPTRPPLILSIARWTTFIVFRVTSLGTWRTFPPSSTRHTRSQARVGQASAWARAPLPLCAERTIMAAQRAGRTLLRATPLGVWTVDGVLG